MKDIMKKFLFAFCLFTLTSAVLTGCSKNSGSKDDANTSGNGAAVVTEDDSQSQNDTITDTESADTSGTNQTTDAVASDTVYPLTISNFTIKDGSWQEKDQIFEMTPSRIVATTQPIAELLIRLGVTDKMVGVAAVYGATSPDIADEFAKIPVLSNEYVGKEITLGANPDFILGRADLYADADWGVGTIDDLNNMNIHTYALNTCKQGANLDSLYKDIAELGTIFNVSDKAQELTDSLKTRVASLAESLSSVEKPLTYAYANLTDGAISIYAGSTDTFQNDALNLMKLDNAFKDATGEINLEQLIATNPDVLLVSYYKGGPDVNEMIEQMYQIDSVQSLSAIQNKQIYVIDYNQFWSYSYQIFDGVENLAKEIYPDLVK